MKMTEFDEVLVMLIDDIILNISELKSISKLIYKKETGLFTQSAASIAYRCINGTL